MGSLQLKFARIEGASKMVGEVEDKEVQAVLKAWRKAGADKGGKATSPWVKRALKALEAEGFAR